MFGARTGKRLRLSLGTLARKAEVAFSDAGASLEVEGKAIGSVFFLAILQLARALRSTIEHCPHGQLRTALKPYEEMLAVRFPHAATKFRKIWRAVGRTDRFADFADTAVRLVASDERDDSSLLSWFYQYLKTPLAKAASRAAEHESVKIAGANLRVATQFFTEPHMVRHLVRECLAEIAQRELPLKRLRVIDPACGGGNFLVEALDFLFKAYCEKGKRPARVATDLLTATLVGYDLDRTLAQVAALSMTVKAAGLLGRLPQTDVSCHGGRDTDERGFLSPQLHARVRGAFAAGLHTVVLTNPPFLGRRMMSPALKDYIGRHYPMAKGDLCAAFMLRCLELMKNGDRAGFVHQISWMFLSSFSRMRRWFVDNYQLDSCIDMGSNAFDDIGGEKARVALSSITRRLPGADRRTRFVRLVNLDRAAKQAAFNGRGFDKRLVYDVDLRRLPGTGHSPFAYIITRGMRRAIARFPRYGEFANPMQGTSTGDNRRFVRYSWEVAADDAGWRHASKGGGYCKWVGLDRFLVFWGKNGEHVRNNQGSAVRNLDRIDRSHLVYSDTGTLGLSTRLLRRGQVFMASGPGIEVLDGHPLAHMAYLNSRTASFFLRALSPKLTVSAGYIGRLPFPEELREDRKLIDWAGQCVSLKEKHLATRLSNDQFGYDGLFGGRSVQDVIRRRVRSDLELEAARLELEHRIEERIQRAFKLSATERKHLDAEVGIPAARYSGNVPSLSAERLDGELAATLDAACQYRPTSQTKSKFGQEGSLEVLSHRYGVAPQALARLVLKNLPKFGEVARVHFNDLLHKGVLFVLGFNAERTWQPRRMPLRRVAEEMARVVRVSRNTLPKYVGEVLRMQDWLRSGLPETHGAVFRGRPILHVEEESIVLSRPT